MKAAVADSLQAVLKPVLAGLPPTATSLFTLMSVAPDARAKVFGQICEDEDRLQGLRGQSVVSAGSASLSPTDRADAFRLVQSLSIAGLHLLGTARLVADGHLGRLPDRCLDAARALVRVSDQTTATFGLIRKPKKLERAAADVHALVTEVHLQGQMALCQDLPAADPLLAVRLGQVVGGLAGAATEVDRVVGHLTALGLRNA
jgi:hypothetical protein